MSTARKAAARGLRKTTHAAARTQARVGDHGVPNLQLTEAQWQARVTTLASFYGWRWYHPGDNLPTINLGAVQKALRARPGPWQPGDLMVMLKRLTHKQDVEPGFPDLVLVRRDPDERAAGATIPEMITAELKTETGRLGAGQAEWAADFTELAARVEMFVDGMNRLAATLASPPVVGPPLLEHRLWRPRDEDLVHDRLARGRARIEPSWFVGEL